MLEVAVVADQPIWRAGLEKLAGDDPDLRMVAAVAALTDLPAGATYDLVVLDAAEPDASTLGLVRGPRRRASARQRGTGRAARI